jgi:hypothetical protein
MTISHMELHQYPTVMRKQDPGTPPFLLIHPPQSRKRNLSKSLRFLLSITISQKATQFAFASNEKVGAPLDRKQKSLVRRHSIGLRRPLLSARRLPQRIYELWVL